MIAASRLSMLARRRCNPVRVGGGVLVFSRPGLGSGLHDSGIAAALRGIGETDAARRKTALEVVRGAAEIDVVIVGRAGGIVARTEAADG